MNGIGGRTIAEAKERLTYEEAMGWSAYLEKRGSIHLGMRLEWGFALIAMTIHQALGGKAELINFMPHAQEQAGTLGDVMRALSGKK